MIDRRRFSFVVEAVDEGHFGMGGRLGGRRQRTADLLSEICYLSAVVGVAGAILAGLWDRMGCRQESESGGLSVGRAQVMCGFFPEIDPVTESNRDFRLD